jgi:cytochrome c oxidase cbb3-type subunit 3
MPTKVEKDALTGRMTTGHEWDGLKELNTPLPKWWLYIFYACIAFAVVWMILYPALPFRGATGLTGWVAREAIVPVVEEAKAKQEPMLARLRAASLPAIVADPEMREFALAGGRVAFANNCAPCHGAGGQGATGGFPTLADDDWLWGGTLDAIRQTIQHGVRDTEDKEARMSLMPPFGQMLTPAQVSDTAEYVLSLSGRSNDAAAATRGKEVFSTQCVACHMPNGKGNRLLGAPNLTDHVWLYGDGKAAIVRQIANPHMGVMPAWAGKLDPAVINMLTVYVHALGGGE